QVNRSALRVAVSDFENATVGTVVMVGIGGVALVLVVPIDHVNRAVGPGLQIDDLRPLVIEVDEIGSVMADEAGTLALGNVHVDARAVDVIHEDFSAILLRPTVLLINQESSMGVAAASRGAAGVAGVRAFVAGPMDVIGNRFDLVVNVRIKMRTSLASEAAALNHVEEMRNDAGFDE